jgi:hypothetical protein
VEFSCDKHPESVLDNPHLKAIVTTSKLIKGGMFSSSYVTYGIYTKLLNATVERRFSDFYWLRSIMVRDFLAAYVN